MKNKFSLKYWTIIIGAVFGIFTGLVVIGDLWQPFNQAFANHLLGFITGCLLGALLGYLGYDWKEAGEKSVVAWRACWEGIGPATGLVKEILMDIGAMLKVSRYHFIYGAFWMLPFACLLITMCGANSVTVDQQAFYMTGIFLPAIFMFVGGPLVAIYVLEAERKKTPARPKEVEKELFELETLRRATIWYLLIVPRLGLLIIYLVTLPIRFTYFLVYYTWSAPRLFHALWSTLCVAIGYPVGVIYDSTPLALVVGIIFGLIIANISHHYLSKRKRPLRAPSWHPLRPFRLCVEG